MNVFIFLSFMFTLSLWAQGVENDIRVQELKTAKEFVEETFNYSLKQGLFRKEDISRFDYGKFVLGSTKTNSPVSSKKYTIYLNLEAIAKNGASYSRVLNHEKLHILFGVKKNFRHKIHRRWLSLSTDEQKSFVNEHPGHNFNNSQVLLKEFFSYTFEHDYKAGEDFLLKSLH